jgi:hypothetical protein
VSKFSTRMTFWSTASQKGPFVLFDVYLERIDKLLCPSSFMMVGEDLTVKGPSVVLSPITSTESADMA